VAQIYTGAKALQFLSVPVYTIFKNLTIIVIAYGEVLWFGGKVTSLILLSFGLMVFSSVVAAWADVHATMNRADAAQAASTLNAGYAWMSLNVVCSASFVLGMRRVIKTMNFKDWDSKSGITGASHSLAGRVCNRLTYTSDVLQQPTGHPSTASRYILARGLVDGQSGEELPCRNSQHDHYGHDLFRPYGHSHIL
jgi:hypothetical protein